MTRLLISLLLFSTDAVEAHQAATGWQYGQECCSTMDCFEEKAVNVLERFDGYFIVNVNELIPYKDVRIKHSRDEFFHRCTLMGNPKAPRSICLYVPVRSF